MPSETTGWESFRERSSIFDLTAFCPGETNRAFEDILRGLYQEFLPVDITEDRLVQRLAVLYWERDRLCRYTQFQMENRQAELTRQIPRAKRIAQLKSAATEFKDRTILNEVGKSVSALEDAAKEGPSPWANPTLPATDDVVENLASLEVPPTNNRDIFIKITEEFPIDVRIEKLERVDVVIDRTIKRLMVVKTMKQLYRQAEPRVISKDR